jgi:hypothetical protein
MRPHEVLLITPISYSLLKKKMTADSTLLEATGLFFLIQVRIFLRIFVRIQLPFCQFAAYLLVYLVSCPASIDWNPAVDKQAAARCWRDGQKKRCFTYRFVSTGTIEERIFQRQLSKEGLQSVVDDKEQVNALSTKDLRNLFKLRTGTPSDIHDKLRCERCDIIHDDCEVEAHKVLPKKLAACRDLIGRLMQDIDASYFLRPINPQDHGVTPEQYDKIVKQPMYFQTISNRLDQALAATGPSLEAAASTGSAKSKTSATVASSYKSVTAFSKDVNRIFSNCMKVWTPEQDEIADAARRLQAWWLKEWTKLVPFLMTMKADDDKAEQSDENVADVDMQNSAAAIKNERSDNYQDQLGMPDEEDMRSWSHHYSTDTVDDPVFRAAMRGYDTVSFVFGLEVTWSLIQQRQQEEEERQAMMELQAIQEMDGEEEDDDAKDSENLKGDAKGSFAAGIMEEDGTHSAGCEVDNGKSEVEIVEEETEEEPKSDGTDHKVIGNTNTSSTLPEVQLSTSLAPISSFEEAKSVSSTGDKENKSPPPGEDGTWKCSMCTFENQSSRKKSCHICGARKPSGARKKPRLETRN